MRMPAGINILGDRSSLRVHLLTEDDPPCPKGIGLIPAVWADMAFQCPTSKPFVFRSYGDQVRESAHSAVRLSGGIPPVRWAGPPFRPTAAGSQRAQPALRPDARASRRALVS